MAKKFQNSHRYDDIIQMSHHVSAYHPQMTLENRAAQFSPFAALTGYDAAVQETARLTDPRVELEEDRKAILNEKLCMVQECLKEHPSVTVTYFEPDEKKAGGAYREYTGAVKKIDTFERKLIFSDGVQIALDDLTELVFSEEGRQII